MKLRSARTPALIVLAAGTIGAVAVPAHASNQYVGRWITEGLRFHSPDRVTVTGNLTFIFHHEQTRVACDVTGEEPIEGAYQPPGEEPGTDETTSFSATGCKQLKPAPICTSGLWEVTATDLPWPSHLIPGAYPAALDVLEGIHVDLRCRTNGSPTFHYAGRARASVGENVLVFKGNNREELSSQAHIRGNLFMRDAEGNSITAGQFCVHFCH
ncbi:MAG: hypothetical protein M3Z95_05135 [Actinomycetota bacterium]|nr:hypothetical protein [Actinomycetota bacterium]